MMRSVVSGHEVLEKSFPEEILLKKCREGKKIQTDFQCKESGIVIPDYDICNSVVQKMIAHVGDDLLHVTNSGPVKNNYRGVQFFVQAIG